MSEGEGAEGGLGPEEALGDEGGVGAEEGVEVAAVEDLEGRGGLAQRQLPDPRQRRLHHQSRLDRYYVLE